MNDSQVKKRITFVYKCDKPEFLFNLAEITIKPKEKDIENVLENYILPHFDDKNKTVVKYQYLLL